MSQENHLILNQATEAQYTLTWLTRMTWFNRTRVLTDCCGERPDQQGHSQCILCVSWLMSCVLSHVSLYCASVVLLRRETYTNRDTVSVCCGSLDSCHVCESCQCILNFCCGENPTTTAFHASSQPCTHICLSVMTLLDWISAKEPCK